MAVAFMRATPITSIPPMLCEQCAEIEWVRHYPKHFNGRLCGRATGRERKDCRAAFKNCAAPMAVIKNFIPMRAARAAV